jgi:phosphoinositide-3-kinase, regulatory subunit 4
MAHLQEHTDAVVALRAAPDQAFFLSASADGSVRVWDCYRLERKKSNRHRLLYYQGTYRERERERGVTLVCMQLGA